VSPTDTTAVDFPPVVYVPCTRHTAVPEELEVRYQTTKDGRRAVLVYSALDRLHRCCGDDQPWFLLPTERLRLASARPDRAGAPMVDGDREVA